MTRKLLIKQTVEAISKLPNHKVQEVSAFVDQLIQKFEDEEIK